MCAEVFRDRHHATTEDGGWARAEISRLSGLSKRLSSASSSSPRFSKSPSFAGARHSRRLTISLRKPTLMAKTPSARRAYTTNAKPRDIISWLHPSTFPTFPQNTVYPLFKVRATRRNVCCSRRTRHKVAGLTDENRVASCELGQIARTVRQERDARSGLSIYALPASCSAFLGREPLFAVDEDELEKYYRRRATAGNSNSQCRVCRASRTQKKEDKKYQSKTRGNLSSF